MELERILGIAHGGDRKSNEHNVPLKTQSDLAKELEMSTLQLRRYKRLLDLVPELQSAVETGMVSATNAGNMRLFYSYVTKIYFPNLTN